MQKPIVIEVSGQPLGVVIPSNEGFRFMAVKYPVFSIDGQVFSSIADARLAAGAAVKAGPGRDEGRCAAA